MPPRPPAAPPPQQHHSHHHNPNHPRSPNEHLIQFYNAEDTLFDAISSFILPSFFSSEHAAVIVATKPHLEALDLYLRQQNLVPELLRKRDQMFLAPAEAILETLMPNGVVEEKIFFDFFGPLFARLQKKYPRLLVYGELVNILCERDEHVKAHELEEVWEAFLLGKDAALLCGYNLNVFSSDGLEDVFQKICRSHSHVTPAEDVRAGGGGVFGRPEDQPMVLAMLQQKNLRLEAEMSRRAAVELALRATLQHLGTKPTDGIRVRDHDGAMAQVTLPPTGIMAATTIDGFTEYFPNDKFLELSGLTASQARRDPGWLGAVHYSDRERVSHTIRLVDGKSRRLEYRFVLPDGSIRWVVGDSVSKETGYVHTAVDITQFRQQETPAPPLRSRTASVASGASGEPSAWLGPPPLPPPPGTAWKRTIGYSRISSPSIPPTTSPVNPIFTRSSSNDAKIAQDLTRVTQLLWENLFPHPPLLHPGEADISAQLSTLYTWYRSQTRAFIPDSSSAFEINNDALQRSSIRLAHTAYFGSIILLSRYPLLRAINRGDFPAARQPRGARRKNELEDLKSAEGAISAGINALNQVQMLVTPSSSSFPDGDSADARTSRVVLYVFFCAALTVLLHLSLDRPPLDDQQQQQLVRITRTLDELHNLPETAEMANHFRIVLQPFINALYHVESDRRRMAKDIETLLGHPTAGIDWLPYRSNAWSWRDLLQAPNTPPVGGRMIPEVPVDRTLRAGEAGTTPPRGLDKRARIAADDGVEWAETAAGVSNELKAMFGQQPPPPP